MPAFPPLFILRHGQTTWNVQGRMQGRLDSPLTALGRAQAEAQFDLMRAIRAHYPDLRAYCSPLGRAVQTAQIALRGMEITEEARIAEVSVGPWEGRLRRDVLGELAPEAPSLTQAGEHAMFELFLSAPEGEGYAVAKARCRDFLAGLQAPSVIVSHGVICAVLRGLACGLGRAGMAKLGHHQGCVVEIIDAKERLIEGALGAGLN